MASSQSTDLNAPLQTGNQSMTASSEDKQTTKNQTMDGYPSQVSAPSGTSFVGGNTTIHISPQGNHGDTAFHMNKTQNQYGMSSENKASGSVHLSAPGCQGDAAVNMNKHIHYHDSAVPEDPTIVPECLKAKLQAKYRTLQIPKLPWLGEWHLPLKHYYVDLTMTPKDDKGRELSGKKIKLQDIFKPTGRSAPPTRVLIEGAAGYGKSTLALKLCYDFGTGEEDYMKQFEHVILLRLREFEGTLDDMIVKTLNVDESKASAVINILHRCEKKLLIILDGWDELNSAKYPLLVPLLKSDVYPQATVIVTSRLGSIPLENEPDSSPSNLLNYYDKRIEIKGVLGNNRTLFLESYLNNFPDEEIATIKKLLQYKFGIEFDEPTAFAKISRIFKVIFKSLSAEDTLFSSPLFLLLLVTLAVETDIKNIETKTDLYKALFNFVVRRSLSKLSVSVDHSDLFEFNKENPPSNVQLLRQFGKLAFDALRNKEVTFSKETLIQHLHDAETFLSYGFLTQNDSVDGMRQKDWFEPVHLSLLEFAAAYYMWLTLLTDLHPADLVYLGDIAQTDFFNDESSLVAQFFIGLLGKDSSIITSRLSSFLQDEEKRKFIDVIQFAKLEMVERVAAAVPLVPKDFSTSFLEFGLKQNDFILAVLAHALVSGIILSVNYNGSKPCNLTLDNPINVDTISFSRQYLARGLWKKSHVKGYCRKLELAFDNCDFRDAIKCICQSIKFEKVVFKLGKCSYEAFQYILEAATDGSLKGARIFLEFYPCITWLDKINRICEIIGKAKIEGMNICFVGLSSMCLWKDFFVCASASQQLKELCVWVDWSNVTLDMGIRFIRGEKMWNRLEFTNVSIDEFYCNDDNHSNVKSLTLTNSLNLAGLHVKSLSFCSNTYIVDSLSNFLQSLHESLPLASSLQELFIPLEGKFLLKENYSKLVHLKQLRVFALGYKEYCELSRGIEKLVSVLSSLPLLKRIELRELRSTFEKNALEISLEICQVIHTIINSTESSLLQNIPKDSNDENLVIASRDTDVTSPDQCRTSFQFLESILLQFHDVPLVTSANSDKYIGLRSLLMSHQVKQINLQLPKEKSFKDIYVFSYSVFPPSMGFIIQPEDRVESDDDPAWYSNHGVFLDYHSLVVYFAGTNGGSEMKT